MGFESTEILMGLFVAMAISANLAALFLLRANWINHKMLEHLKNKCATCIYMRGIYYESSVDKSDK